MPPRKSAPSCSLLPCAGCSRHVRSTEGRCPFCGHDLRNRTAAAVVPDPPHRLGRVERLAFAAAFLGACQTAGPAEAPPEPADVGVVGAADASPPATAADVPAPRSDGGGGDVALAPAVPCPLPAPDAGARRRARPHPRPRLPPTAVHPCYGVPAYGD